MAVVVFQWILEKTHSFEACILERRVLDIDSWEAIFAAGDYFNITLSHYVFDTDFRFIWIYPFTGFTLLTRLWICQIRAFASFHGARKTKFASKATSGRTFRKELAKTSDRIWVLLGAGRIFVEVFTIKSVSHENAKMPSFSGKKILFQSHIVRLQGNLPTSRLYPSLFGCLGTSRQEEGLRRYIQKGTHLGMFVDSMGFRSLDGKFVKVSLFS